MLVLQVVQLAQRLNARLVQIQVILLMNQHQRHVFQLVLEIVNALTRAHQNGAEILSEPLNVIFATQVAHVLNVSKM